MKIVIPSVRDTGGTGWTLAHAINSVCEGEHQALDMTGQKSYINYPTMAHMGLYTKSRIRKMIYDADVVAFLGSFRPIYTFFKLNPRKLKSKLKLFVFMGSEWRNGRKGLLEHMRKYVKGPSKIVVGSPCMMMPAEDEDKTPCPDDVGWLPVVRSFDELQSKYGMCNQDRLAVEAFGADTRKVYFMHAPTSEERKGSTTFYYAMTRAQQLLPNLNFKQIRGQPWVTCLQAMAESDLLFDQDPPFPETYGGISVEAAAFHLPIVSRIDPYAMEFWKRETGLECPVIQWTDDDDLFKKVYLLAKDKRLRMEFGERCHRFFRAIHDEKPVVERFMKYVEAM